MIGKRAKAMLCEQVISVRIAEMDVSQMLVEVSGIIRGNGENEAERLVKWNKRIEMGITNSDENSS